MAATEGKDAQHVAYFVHNGLKDEPCGIVSPHCQSPAAPGGHVPGNYNGTNVLGSPSCGSDLRRSFFSIGTVLITFFGFVIVDRMLVPFPCWLSRLGGVGLFSRSCGLSSNFSCRVAVSPL